MQVPVTIIIPTYKRKESLLRTIVSLQAQTYPAGQMEVIVVFDGPSDETVGVLQSLKTAFALKIIEQEKSGAATARNAGASIASGTILIFLDDDIEASPSLVEAHVNAHSNQTNRVVIGYLPPIIYCDNEFFSPAVREWWENEFDAMRHRSHRFHYRNLTSGNFSIFHQFFAEVGGFNIDFICQEDYELGLRLLQKGAAFQFSEEAMGYHHDMTNIEKLAGRRCCEAQAAVMFAKQYPELLPSLPYLQRLQVNVGRGDRFLLALAYQLPFLAGVYQKYLSTCLRVAQQLRRRKSWKSFHKKLLDLQFFKGLAIATGTVEELKKIVRPINDRPVAVPPPLKIDLRKGISEAELKLDETRPAHVELYYGDQLIGSLVQVCGFEPYKGAHLRAILAKEFQWDILMSLAFDKLGPSGANDTKSFFALTEKMLTYGYSGSTN